MVVFGIQSGSYLNIHLENKKVTIWNKTACTVWRQAFASCPRLPFPSRQPVVAGEGLVGIVARSPFTWSAFSVRGDARTDAAALSCRSWSWSVENSGSQDSGKYFS